MILFSLQDLMDSFVGSCPYDDIKTENTRKDECITLVRAALGPPDDSESDIIETVLQLESDRKSSIRSNTSNQSNSANQSNASSVNVPVPVSMLDPVKLQDGFPATVPPPPQADVSRCDVMTFHDIETNFSVNPQKPPPSPLEMEDDQSEYILLKLKEPITNENLDTTLQNQQNNSPIVASSSSSEMIVEKIHENKKHKCTFTGCDRSFVRPAELLRHKRTHTNERPYVCPTCKHEFKRKDHLKSHILIHTDEKKYSCKRCDYRTNRLDTLKRHFKTRHQKLGGPRETSPAKAKPSVAEYNRNQVEY
jgi:uncharacterized Zn-finger protein